MIIIIKNNIKTAWKTKKAFVILLILVQMLSAFAILFVMGAISNDYMSLKEDMHSNTYLYLNINDRENNPIYFKDIEKMFFDIDEEFNGIYSSIGVSFPYIYGDNFYTSIFCKFSIENGKYITNSTLDREKLDLISGQIFTNETLNSDICYATLSADDGQYSEKYYAYNDTKIEIIGVEKTTERGSTALVFNPATARKMNVSVTGIVLSLNRILAENELDELLQITDRYMGGSYSTQLETYSNEDAAAVLKSTFSVSAITMVATVIVLFIIYNFFFTLRKNNYAIMQICGCRRLKGTFILQGEMMLLSVPSIILGTLIFRLCQKYWLNSIFMYMEITITTKVCLYFTIFEIVAIFVLFFLLSFWFSMKSIKSQLIYAKE